MASGTAQEPGPAGAPLELDIERLAAGGDGIAHAPDGRVVFVPRTAPGDRVRARVIESRRRFHRAELLEVLKPGPDRIEPPCPVFDRCGGCSWQHLGYAAQRAAKAQALRDAFERLAHLVPPGPVGVRASAEAYAYRGRARVQVEAGRVGFRASGAKALVAVDGCPVLVPALEQALIARCADPPSPPGEWELAMGDDGEVRVHPLGVRGGPRITIRAPGSDASLAVSPGVFFQAHAGLRLALGDAALEAMGSGSKALELYAGAGFLTLGLAARFSSVVAVEHDAAAVADLRANLHEARVHGVRVERARVERWLDRARRDGFDAVLLDPPRTGLPRGAVARLASLRARRIVYVACDPATLARDCAALCAAGYGLASLEGFDLFPQTPHLEAIAVLDLGGAA